LLLLALVSLAVPSFSVAQQPTRAIAITVDDLPAVSLRRDVATHAAITRGILDAFRRYGVPAIGFVNESKLADGDRIDSARVALLRAWLDAGMQLGNHSYSHPDLHGVPLEQYEDDVLRGERVTRSLLAERGLEPRWFRHPFLHTGTDLDTKRRFERFLDEHGYRVAPVTFDNYDFIFARVYERTVESGDRGTAQRVADAYVAYMDSVVGYYEAQSRTLFGTEPAQVLLLHANRLNADHVGRVLESLVRRGYRFVTIDEALRDPAYSQPDEYIGAGGITWLHRWALTAGKRGAVFAGEPTVPEWIATRFEGR
jgi:peptidoglycan/xylan/chitin deacetylase (PgdA/CDA1 family)